MGEEDEDEILQYSLSWSRYALYVTTMGLIGAGCFFFSTFTGYSGVMYLVLLALGVVSVLLLYVYLPYKVQEECLSPLLVKGRAFLGLYHLGLLLALPAFALFYLSHGRKHSLKPQTVGISLELLRNQTLAGVVETATIFKASDGFVAVNSSVSIVTTLSKHQLPVYDSLYFQYPEISPQSYERTVPDVFYAEAKVWQSPFDEFPITAVRETHPDARDQLTVAPLFARGDSTACVGRFPPVHVTCSLDNPLIGFALATDRSLCRDYAGVTICREAVHLGSSGSSRDSQSESPLTLQPRYDCSGSGSGGLCGRVAATPSEQMREAIFSRMAANGWSMDAVDTARLLWVEVNDLSECELDRGVCEELYTQIGYAAAGTLTLVLLFIFSALVLDLYADILVARLANDYKYRQIAKINTLYTS